MHQATYEIDEYDYEKENFCSVIPDKSATLVFLVPFHARYFSLAMCFLQFQSFPGILGCRQPVSIRSPFQSLACLRPIHRQGQILQ